MIRRRSPIRFRRRWRDWLSAYGLALPFFVVLGVFVIYPIAQSIVLSFQDFSYLKPNAASWVGLGNYRELVSDRTFRRAAWNTILLTALVVPIQTGIALLLASALNARIRARGFFRTIYFLPYITAPVAVGAIMVVLFQRRGIVTMLLHELVGTPLVTWYARPPYAFILVVFVLIWTQVGFFTVLYLAGLQNIGKDVYEAAAVDGAGARQRFRYVTVPLLRPTSFLVVVIGIIVTLQVFEQPFVLSTTGGALPGSPGDSTLTMVMYLYTEAFRYFDMGIAAAAALVIFVVIVAFTLLLVALQRRAEA
ncbi:MAG TPA: sugar ABC transporter permease [Actinobacteria bacterium]|nr:sugar ABC transporter permease [Actinomycetota bacterium]